MKHKLKRLFMVARSVACLYVCCRSVLFEQDSSSKEARKTRVSPDPHDLARLSENSPKEDYHSTYKAFLSVFLPFF